MLMPNISQENRDLFIKSIFASIAPNIDFLSSFFSFGLDKGWRKKLVSREDACEACCKTSGYRMDLDEKEGAVRSEISQ